jgi:hypothetical protein
MQEQAIRFRVAGDAAELEKQHEKRAGSVYI